MPSNPEPDEYGRYRVRRKGDTASSAWSTRNYDPERHVIVSGPASDTYGAAWPPKPHRRLASGAEFQTPVPSATPAGTPTPTPSTTTNNEGETRS